MATGTKGAAKEQKVEIKTAWKERLDLDHTIADEAFLQLLNDRYYLTFGQLRIPLTGEPAAGTVNLEIHPVAKLVLSKEGLEKIRDMLNRMLPTED